MKRLFSIIIAIGSISFVAAQSYLPTTGGTLTGNLNVNLGSQIQAPYLGFNAGNVSPANSSNVAIFPNSATYTLDFVSWYNGWNFIPVGVTPYPGPVVSIDNNGNIRTNGSIGIGTTNPLEKLDLNGNLKLNNGTMYWDWTGRSIGQYSPDNGNSQVIRFKNSMGAGQGNVNGGFEFTDYTGEMSVLRINNFNVGIGTTNPQSKLAVNGTIQVKEVKVTTAATDWPDYVFTPEHQLPSLEILATQIKTQGLYPIFLLQKK